MVNYKSRSADGLVNPLSLLAEFVAKYSQTQTDSAHNEITQSLGKSWPTRHVVTPTDEAALKKIMVVSATQEPLWCFLAGQLLWHSGRQSSIDFDNVWGCSRFSGINSRYSTRSATDYLKVIEHWTPDLSGPALFVSRGNAFRQLHRYSNAEDTYLEGIDRFPEDPFLRFRLIDLCLMTHQSNRAKYLLAGLNTHYPSALEMMFALPVQDTLTDAANLLPEFSARDADFVWFVACDPVYAEKYGLQFAKTVAAKTQGKTHLHFHVVRDLNTPNPSRVIEAIAGVIRSTGSDRTVNLENVSENQRSALFASERFLLLADLLQRYAKPLIVSDVDLECLRDPHDLILSLGDAEIGLTRFDIVRDAWDKYPATVIVALPTMAAIRFFKQVAATIVSLLNTHPKPWFADQIALYRVIEEGATSAKIRYLSNILTDNDSPHAYLRTLHGSWAQK